MSPLLYQLSYTATGLDLLKKCGGMIAEARWKCLPMERVESTGEIELQCTGMERQHPPFEVTTLGNAQVKCVRYSFIVGGY